MTDGDLSAWFFRAGALLALLYLVAVNHNPGTVGVEHVTVAFACMFIALVIDAVPLLRRPLADGGDVA